jgi:hypothetical protein
MPHRREFYILSCFVVAFWTMALVVAPSAHAESKLLAAANKQISSKNYKAAVRTLTKAMNSGLLSDEDMATALMRRGVAQNGAGRHASAIADLRGAIWLGKLSSANAKQARSLLALSYQATGHGNRATKDLAGRSRSRPSSSSPDASALALPAFTTTVSPASEPSVRSASKPKQKKKDVVPAFRTSISSE